MTDVLEETSDPKREISFKERATLSDRERRKSGHYIKLGAPVEGISVAEKHTIFQALAVDFLIRAFESMPLSLTINSIDSPDSGRISDRDYHYLARSTLRWLLLNGYVTSTEFKDANSQYSWNDNTNDRIYIGFDIVITDKGLSAVAREIPWNNSGKIGKIRNTAKEVIKGALRAETEDILGGLVDQMQEVFVNFFSSVSF